MGGWAAKVRITDLLTEKEDHEAVQASMTAIAHRLADSGLFRGFSLAQFLTIPKGDDIMGPVDYANRLLERMYDYANHNGIWVESMV